MKYSQLYIDQEIPLKTDKPMTLTNKRPNTTKSRSVNSLDKGFNPQNDKIKILLENNKKVQKFNKNLSSFTLKINNYNDKIYNNYESTIGNTVNNTTDENNMQLILYDDEDYTDTSKSKIRTNFDIFKEVY